MTRVAAVGLLVAALVLPLGPGAGAAPEPPADPAASGTTEDPTTTEDGSTEGVDDEVSEEERRARSLSFRVATINVLGSSHTDGPRSKYASGVRRVDNLIRVLQERRLPVAGLQEFQPDQRLAFARKSDGWGMYPGGTKWDTGTTSVVWRVSRFQFVKARLTAMPFYGKKQRMSPSVLLRDIQTGMRFWVTSVHNPRDGGRYRNQSRQRSVATQRQIGLVLDLARTRIPHVLTGDMNEKGSYYCRFTGPGATNMRTPAGGSNTGGNCRPPARSALDWIFGSGRMQWSGFVVDRSALVRRTTDHPVRYATATVTGKAFPGSWSRR